MLIKIKERKLMRKELLASLTVFGLMLAPVMGQSVKQGVEIPLKQQHRMKNSIVGSYPQQVDWYSWSGTAWTPSQVDHITYNGLGDPVTVINDLAAGTDVKITYEYNSFRMPTLILIQNLSGANWINIQRSRFEFDSWGNVTLEVVEKYQDGEWKTETGIKLEYELSGGKPVKYTISHYNPQTQLYTVVSRTTQTYDSNGLVATMMNEVYEAGNWVNSSRVAYTWKSADEMASMLMENWETNQWVFYGRYDYTYTTYGSFTAIFNIYEPESQQYMPYLRETTTYDSHGNLTLQTTEAWLGIMWMVTSGTKIDLTYQGNNPTQKITQEYSGMDYQNMTKEVFSNFLSLGKEEDIVGAPDMTVYPNPATDQLNIRLKDFPVNSSVRIEILDFQGRVVTTANLLTNPGTLLMDLTSVPQGNYIVRVTSSTGKLLQKPVMKR